MDIFLGLAAIAVIVMGLAGSVLPMIPGIPMVFGGLWLLAWSDHFQHVGMWTLMIIGFMALVAMGMDLIAGALGAKRVGASKMAIWGALAGTFIGMFFGLPSLVFGPFLGALAGELLNGNSVLRSTHVSIGTWVGMLLGTLAKLVLALMMIGLYAFVWMAT